jgi:hypothetical protein
MFVEETKADIVRKAIINEIKNGIVYEIQLDKIDELQKVFGQLGKCVLLHHDPFHSDKVVIVGKFENQFQYYMTYDFHCFQKIFEVYPDLQSQIMTEKENNGGAKWEELNAKYIRLYQKNVCLIQTDTRAFFIFPVLYQMDFPANFIFPSRFKKVPKESFLPILPPKVYELPTSSIVETKALLPEGIKWRPYQGGTGNLLSFGSGGFFISAHKKNLKFEPYFFAYLFQEFPKYTDEFIYLDLDFPSTSRIYFCPDKLWIGNYWNHDFIILQGEEKALLIFEKNQVKCSSCGGRMWVSDPSRSHVCKFCNHSRFLNQYEPRSACEISVPLKISISDFRPLHQIHNGELGEINYQASDLKQDLLTHLGRVIQEWISKRNVEKLMALEDNFSLADICTLELSLDDTLIFSTKEKRIIQ